VRRRVLGKCNLPVEELISQTGSPTCSTALRTAIPIPQKKPREYSNQSQSDYSYGVGAAAAESSLSKDSPDAVAAAAGSAASAFFSVLTAGFVEVDNADPVSAELLLGFEPILADSSAVNGRGVFAGGSATSVFCSHAPRSAAPATRQISFFIV